MMKKTILLFITLSVMALAVVFAFTHTYAPQDKVLKENMAALAQNLPIEDEEDGSSADPAGGGGAETCYQWYSASPNGGGSAFQKLICTYYGTCSEYKMVYQWDQKSSCGF